MAEQTLSDVKVLDLGDHIIGPYCAKMLADYGADVIKIEVPGSGDTARRAGPFPGDVPDSEKSGLFLHLNTNKRGITLDLKSAAGRKIFAELVKWADILVENLPPSFLPSLGLSYQDLEAINPRLVMTSITPFGQTGPYKDFKATDLVAFAMTTRMYVHGYPDREPLRYGPDIPWFQTGLTAAAATMGAFYASRVYGVGQQVDISAVECLAGNVDSRILSYGYTGVRATRLRPGAAYPNGAYPCRDGFMLFAASGDRFFRRLCRAMGRSDLLEDPRWATPEARPLYRDDFEAIFLPWLLDRTRMEAFQASEAEGVMCAPIWAVNEVFSDPQLLARKYFVEIGHPKAGRWLFPGAPFTMMESTWEVRRPAPLLGQHNAEVYCGILGYSKGELVRLRELRII